MKKIFVTLGIVGILFAGAVPHVAEATQGKLVQCEGPDDCTFDTLVETGSAVVQFLFEIATAIAVIVIAYAGFLYMTAGGNTGNITKAHQLIWYAVIGFLVALSAWLIVEVLLNTLQVDGQFKPSDFK